MVVAQAVKKVLICEDDGVTGVAIRKALMHAGYFVIVGVEIEGKKAVAMARQLRPDLVLMDIGLSGSMSGIDAARHILLEQNIPVIMLTGYRDEEHIAGAQEAGACAYLVKPFTSEQLLLAVEAALTRYDDGMSMQVDSLSTLA